MTAFRILLVAMLIVLATYTGLVVADFGLNLFPYFIGDILAMNWAGQFNTDFMGYLILSALWYAWRDHFSPRGLVLGLFGFFLGMSMIIPYLLVVSYRGNGNMAYILLGPQRAAALRA